MSGPQAEARPLLEVPLAAWPAGERAAWKRATTRTHSPFRRDNGGPTLSRYTYLGRQKSYGRWLGYVRGCDTLDDTVSPESRVTPDRLDAYIEDMRARGNRPITIIGRIHGLKAALDMLAPGEDHKWIVHPQGIPIEHYFEIVLLDRPAHHSATLLTWAEKLFASGLAHHKPRCRRALVRDAAMIGVLVMPAPRLGALAQLQLERNLQRRQDAWCIDQNAGITKMSKDEWSPLHPAVTPMLDRYLAVERNELLDGRLTRQLWIAQGGGDLTGAGITTRLRKLSGRDFEKVFRAHLFRRSLATTSAVDGFASPGDGGILLGHTNPTTTNRHYNRAKTMAAATRQAERVERMTRDADRASRSGSW